MLDCSCVELPQSVGSTDRAAGFEWQGRQFTIVPLEQCAAPGSVAQSGRVTGRFAIEGVLFAVVENVPAIGQSPGETADPLAVLTARELQIAAMMAAGRRTKQVAHALRISEWTVGTHLRRIYSKLGVRTRVELALRCVAAHFAEARSRPVRRAAAGDVTVDG